MNNRFNRNTRTRRAGYARSFLLLCALVALALGASAQTTNPNARLLFKSGFESNVVLNPVSGYNSTYQTLSGVDGVTGFAWPMMQFNPHPELTGLQSIIGSGTPEPITSYIQNSIGSVTGPNGTPTRALRMNISKASPNHCCIQDSLQMASINDDVRDVYIRYWLKLGPEVASQAQQGGAFWRAVFAMKTRNDYRIEAYVYGDSSGRPYWYAQGDTNTGSGMYNQHWWDASNKTVPVPMDQWFLQEIYIHRSSGSDGRFFWAVNGQKLIDRYGNNYGVDGEQINCLMYNITYGSLYPQSQMIDDLEVWNVPPCTTLPCGSGGSTGGTAPTAPTADAQAPTVPANLTATRASGSQIDLAWGASTDNVGVAGYRIYRNGGATPVGTVATTRYQDTGLAGSTAYSYTVAAFDAAGNVSAKSSAASATTDVAAVSLLRGKMPASSGALFEAQRITDADLTAANTAGVAAGRQWIQFDLGLTYALTGVKVWHYFGSADRIYNDVIVQTSNAADFSSGVSTVFNNDSDNSSGLGVGTDAAYTETAAGKTISFTPRIARYIRLWSNGSNMNAWNHYTEVEAYGTASGDAVPPTVPAGLTATAVSPTQINLSWSASTDNVGVGGYRIFRNGAATPIATVSGTTYQNTGLAASTTYTYTVLAFDAAGNVSLQSSPVSAITQTPAAVVTNLVRGKAPISGATLYSPQYITNGSTAVAEVAGAAPGPQWIQFDLGRIAAVNAVKVWHYYGSADRVYNDVIVQVSNAADFSSGVTTVFNNDRDNSSGRGAGADAAYTETSAGKSISFTPVNGRYVRLWSNGSNMNQWNHYTEVEVLGQ